MNNPERVDRIIIFYLLALAVIALIGGYFFPMKAWGLSLLAQYPAWVWIFFTIFYLLGLIPSIREKLSLLLEGENKEPSLDSIKKNPGYSRRFVLAISLFAGLAAILFTVRSPIMGDGIDFIYNYSLQDPYHRHYPFFSAILYGLHKFLIFLNGNETPAAGDLVKLNFQVWALIAGLGAAIFVTGFLRVLPLLSDSRISSRIPAALVLSSGTMVLFSGFIEVTVGLVAGLCIYTLTGLLFLRGNSSPWALFAVFFLCLGLHVSAVALVPSLAWLLFIRREDIRNKPWPWIKAFAGTGAVFLILVASLVSLKSFLLQFIGGDETLKAGVIPEKALFAYGLFSPLHLFELVNVILLHNPLSLVMLAWLAYALIRHRKILQADNISVFLSLLFFSYFLELFLFHAYLGVFRDWDIYAPLGFFLPLAACRMWAVAAPSALRPNLARYVAVLLPFALAQLLLWEITIHDPELIIRRMVSYAQAKKFLSSQAEEYLQSNLSTYCVEEDYLPDFIIDYAGTTPVLRMFLISRLCVKKKTDQVLDMLDRWPKMLDPVENANLGWGLFKKEQYDLSLYFLRLAWFQYPDYPFNLYSLVYYYSNRQRFRAMFYYFWQLPQKEREDIRKNLPSLQPAAEEPNIGQAMEALKPRAAVEIFNNGVLLADSGFTHSAVLEFQAALKLGMDSLPVYEKLAAVSIRRRDWTKAEMYCKLCRRLSKEGWSHIYNLAMVYALSGKKDMARELYTILYALKEVEPNYLNRLERIIQR